MKKFIVFLLTFLVIFSFTFALNINQDDKDKIDKAINIVDTSLNKQGLEYKITQFQNIYSKIKLANSLLTQSKNREKLIYLEQQLKSKINDLQNGIEVNIDEIQEELSTYNGIDSSLEYLDPNIDRDKFRKTRLSWQNQEREKLNLEPLAISETLNKTTAIRAKYLSNKNSNSGLHKRKSTDGYYNFDSMYDWFNTLGVDFEWIDGAPFTENIGYGYLKCSNNCTDALITATKKTFDFFMKEKSYNGAHYRAISHNLFGEVGISAVVKNGKYYVVLHYATKVID